MNRMPGDTGDGLWPTPVQLALIKAAVLNGDQALAAWDDWQQAVNLNQSLDPTTFRLLPLLYCNLHSLGVSGGEMPRLKGLYRNAWYLNNLLLHTLSPLLHELDQAGFRLMFLKGLPLGRGYYLGIGARPMNDVDVMVPLEQAEAVVQWMDARGYARHWTMADGGIAHRHSIPYNYNDKEIDIHWHLLRDCGDGALANAIWEQAEAFDYDGISAWTLSPTDMLFHQILHGLRWNAEPSIRWIPDAWTVIHERGQQLDWSRLLWLCQRFAFSDRLHLGLRFLRDELGADVPAPVIDTLSRHGNSLVERMERTYVLRDHRSLYANPLGKLWITLADYQSQDRRRRLLPHLLGFSHFLRVRWRAQGRLEIARSAVSGCLRRLGNLAR